MNYSIAIIQTIRQNCQTAKENSPEKNIPIPAKAGISLTSNCFGARCQKTVRDSGRFPLSREWEKEGNGERGGNGKRDGNGERGAGMKERGREWGKESGNGICFLPPAACGGGVRAQSGRGGWRVGDDVWRFATPQKFAGANFYPPPQAAEGGISCREIPAFAGMEERGGNGRKGAGMERGSGNGERGGDEERGREWGKESGNGIYFLPSAACGGGCERKAVAGGGELAMMFGVSPPPKNSLARIFTPPPRKRRRVELVVGRFPPSREWKKGAGMEKGAGMKAGREWKECQRAGDKKAFPFPRKRESPRISNCLLASRSKTVRG